MNKRFFLFVSLLFSISSFAQSSTGLFVCDIAGQKSIVNEANKPSHAQCSPYTPGSLGGGGITVVSSDELTGKTPPKDAQATATATPTQNSQPEQITDISTGKKFDITGSYPSPTPDKDAGKTFTLDTDKEQVTGKKIELDGQKSAPKAGTKQEKTAKDGELLIRDNESAELSLPAPTPDYEVVKIYLCDGGNKIVEDTTPPDETCYPIGVKAETGKDGEKKPATEPLVAGKSDKAKNRAMATASTPKDIYKCFDDDGTASYVAEDQQEHYKNCSFFSKSYQGARAELANASTSSKSKDLASLAAKGVGVSTKEEEYADAALRCTGAGTIKINGEERKYNCATRSFDMTPGTTGGQISYGDKTATISAHSLDYLATGGSCGGTVTTSEGRVLRIAPDKECPPEVQIAARQIEEQYIKTISISVNNSAAFRERQRQLAAQVNEIAEKIGVDPYLVHAVISAESAYKSKAVSPAGAGGLMQLMPATARRFGVSDRFHTGENIRGGATYLKWLLNEFNGNYQLAIAAYNAGEGNVRKYGYQIPPFIETRAYVPKVLEYYRRYKANPSQIGL